MKRLAVLMGAWLAVVAPAQAQTLPAAAPDIALPVMNGPGGLPVAVAMDDTARMGVPVVIGGRQR